MKVLVLSLACFLSVGSVCCGDPHGVTEAPGNSTVTLSTHRPGTRHTGNGTMTGDSLDGSMIQRALYVLIGITIIGVLYFLVRAVRLKKSSTPRKKYGLLANYDDTVEMAQLESDEDDNTVYEAKSLRR